MTVVTSASRSWRWGGAAWRCLEYASSSGRQGCALSVADATGRLLALGDADPAVQDELAAEYGTVLRADVLIAPPGGVVDQVLLEAARPAAVAGPTARGSTPGTAPLGYAVERTGVDGDLAFIGGAAGLQVAR